MESPEPKRPTRGESEDNTLLADVLEHITTVVHVLTLGLTLFVLYLCFQDDTFSLTTWHVFLYTIGWTLLTTEGLLYLAKENILSKRTTSRWRKHIHWVVILLGMGFSLGGLITIYKNRRSHFTSNHAITGLASGVLGVVACLNGIPTLFSTSLRKIISPNWNKLFHAFIGFAGTVLGAYAMITGYMYGWFTRRTTDTMVDVCFAVTVIITFWALLKPCINMIVRTRNIFS